MTSGAEPDEAHERIEVDAHRVAAVVLLVAEHHVEIAAPGDMDAGFGGRLRRRVVEALRRLEPRHGRAAARHVEQADLARGSSARVAGATPRNVSS